MTYLADPERISAGAPKLAFPPAAVPRAQIRDRGQLEGPRPALISRMRFQLPGALFAAIVPPLLYAWNTSDSLPDLFNTVAATFCAVALGYWVLRHITNFPTSHEVAAVPPVFTGAFGLVFAGFYLARLEFSAPSLLSGYGLSMVWLVVVMTIARRGKRRQFALIPIGEALSIHGLEGASWQVIDASEALPHPCSGVVVDLRADMSAEWQQFLTACVLAGVPVFHFKQVREVLTGQLEIEHLSENMLGSHNPHHAYLAFKRSIDTLTALVALVLLAPLLLCVAALIRLDSKGPALFTQARIKQGGSTFTIYKFRTMLVDTARPGSRNDAITREGDPRITRLGAFLRKTRIDELPQILNILKGEMSWIGPRPEAVPLAQWYQQQLPFYQYRHIVPPGISGWAQVNQGHVTDPKHVLGKLHYDFFYIKNFSIWLDMLIVLKTLRTMLTGFGAR